MFSTSSIAGILLWIYALRVFHFFHRLYYWSISLKLFLDIEICRVRGLYFERNKLKLLINGARITLQIHANSIERRWCMKIDECSLIDTHNRINDWGGDRVNDQDLDQGLDRNLDHGVSKQNPNFTTIKIKLLDPISASRFTIYLSHSSFICFF